MNLVTKKFGETTRFAFGEQESLKLSSIVVGDHSIWKTRSRFLGKRPKSNAVMQLNADQAHLISELDEAMEWASGVVGEQLVVVACGSAVVPAISVMSKLAPRKLVLISPAECQNMDNYQFLLNQNLAHFKGIPSKKVVYEVQNAFSSNLVSVLESASEDLDIVEVQKFSDLMRQTVFSPSYLSALVAE